MLLLVPTHICQRLGSPYPQLLYAIIKFHQEEGTIGSTSSPFHVGGIHLNVTPNICSLGGSGLSSGPFQRSPKM
jgi:hypothetical protein